MQTYLDRRRAVEIGDGGPDACAERADILGPQVGDYPPQVLNHRAHAGADVVDLGGEAGITYLQRGSVQGDGERGQCRADLVMEFASQSEALFLDCYPGDLLQ